MQTEHFVVYVILTLLIACAMELVDVVFKKIKAAVKAKRLEKAQQSIKEDE